VQNAKRFTSIATNVCPKLGFTDLNATPPTPEELKDPANEKLLKDLHTLLLETQVMEGKLVCGNCGHEYAIKEGIANFLLPNHLGECDHARLEEHD